MDIYLDLDPRLIFRVSIQQIYDGLITISCHLDLPARSLILD